MKDPVFVWQNSYVTHAVCPLRPTNERPWRAQTEKDSHRLFSTRPARSQCACVSKLLPTDKRRVSRACVALCSSSRTEQLGYDWTDFHEIWYLSFFWRDNVYSFVLMGVHHSSSWRHILARPAPRALTSGVAMTKQHYTTTWPPNTYHPPPNVYSCDVITSTVRFTRYV